MRTHALSTLACLLFTAGTALSATPTGTERLKPALDDGRLGLFPNTEYRLTTGRCDDCQTPKPALWYFAGDALAVPRDPQQQDGTAPLPFLIWLGAPDLIEDAHLTADQHSLRIGQQETVPLTLVPQLSLNRSFYNKSTAQFFAHQPLRVRGRLQTSVDGGHFEARTIWPADFLLTPETAHAHPYLARDTTFRHLIEEPADTQTLTTSILWAREGTGSTWAGKPVLALMLNGAQGDDDEAHGGHFGIVTGRMGPHGEWADWLVNNFYDPDVVSEKGIVPAMVPMDNYLYDLNSGQSYYRPSYMVVFVLRQDRIPLAYQREMQQAFLRLYNHQVDYDHTRSNCAGLSIDTLRNLGWQIPTQGPSSRLKAAGAFVYLTAADRSFASGQKIYRYFMEEQTRLLPRVTFEAVAEDALRLVTSQSAHDQEPKTDFEGWLLEDLDAVVFVTIPQTPSSRTAGTYPVVSLDDYQGRVPADRSQWKTVAVPARPFPAEWRPGPSPREAALVNKPIVIATALTAGIGFVVVVTRRQFLTGPNRGP